MLIIDDDVHIRRLMIRVLSAEGYEVVEAEDGIQGLRLFRENPPSVVILDMFMPEKEGLETLRDMRRERSSVPVIAISGGGSSKDPLYLALASKLGAKATLAKPFLPAQLLDAIVAVLPREPGA